MSTVRPPLPPRRSVPPLPPRKVGDDNEPGDAGPPVGIAARIASLHLEGSGGRPPLPPPRVSRSQPNASTKNSPQNSKDLSGYEESPDAPGVPPPVPSRSTRPSTNPDRARALARRPPPPPASKKPRIPIPDLPKLPARPSVPEGPRRRVPPPPTRIPSPPSEPEEETDRRYGFSEPTSGPDPSPDQCLKCRDFAHVDSHAALYPRHTVGSLDNLAHDLTVPFETETEKFRALFSWLHHNIAYDAQAFVSGNIYYATPEATLSSGLAVCDGYAGLFKALADSVGLQAHRVSGHGKGIGYAATVPGQPAPPLQSNHAWNCVLMDGVWQLIDTCWGSGVLDGATYRPNFDPAWFSSTPAEFGRRHYPSDPTYQLLSDEEGGPVSWETYILEPQGPIIFQDFYALDLAPYLLQPCLGTVQGGRHISFHLFKRCEHKSTADADNFAYIISYGENMKVPLERDGGGGWSVTLYIPRGGEVSLFSVIEVGGENGKGLGASGFRKADGRKGMSFGGLARWTIT